ncbi:hypothetical protein M8305_07735 [Enterobacter roggenkampii]|uniref:hypothetical protein n=1 Tax=Enterobacter roggenkampii TaxID=1812935 RepID=UPI001658E2B2|nr:hypothetical protein [Enterobacter roggenkampii]MCL8137693.1 hypothetical protein [Enterobacter roggenkampii]MCM8150410.1 hypothetical protein [Enterobacter roggenkampii]QNQ31395.1 hypothetical protein H9W87_09935 [Enterobacter roggenkampii]
MSDFEEEDVVQEENGSSGLFKPLETIPGATANRDQMAELHQLICIALSARIRAGIWSSGDIAAATKFLKDNNVTADVGDNAALQELRESLERKQQHRRDANKGRALTPEELAEVAMLRSKNDGCRNHAVCRSMIAAD